MDTVGGDVGIDVSHEVLPRLLRRNSCRQRQHLQDAADTAFQRGENHAVLIDARFAEKRRALPRARRNDRRRRVQIFDLDGGIRQGVPDEPFDNP